MRILISNDDGIFAPGIAALVRAFSDAGHEVIVSAPDSQRSAASHSLSIGKPLRVKETHMDGAARAYAVSGTPADCVKLALHVLCPDAEAVISGVNLGWNIGTDVLYSGTVAAAMEGALLGRPAVAVSLAFGGEDAYPQAAALAAKAFGDICRKPLPPYTVLNINYPARDSALGLHAAPLKVLRYLEDYVPGLDEAGEKTYTLSGCLDETMEKLDDDYTWLTRGYATATVLSYNMTDYAATNALSDE